MGTFFHTNNCNPYALSGASGAVSLRDQQVTYNAFKQPVSITENDYLARFDYNSNGVSSKTERTIRSFSLIENLFLVFLFIKNTPNVMSNFWGAVQVRAFLMLLLYFFKFTNLRSLSATVNNTKNNNFIGFNFINDIPTHTYRFSVNLSFGWNFFALPKCQRVLLNTVYCLKYVITDTDSV